MVICFTTSADYHDNCPYTALIAVLRSEAEARHCALTIESNAVQSNAVRCMFVSNLVEAAVATDGKRDPYRRSTLDELINEARISVEPVK